MPLPRNLDALTRILVPNRAAPIPVAHAQVPECEDGYDWRSPCSHNRPRYSRHVSVPFQSRLRLPWGKLWCGCSIGQDSLVPENCNSRSRTGTCRGQCLFADIVCPPPSFNVLLSLSPDRLKLGTCGKCSADEEYEIVLSPTFDITY
jgi:hypothetical protein